MEGTLSLRRAEVRASSTASAISALREQLSQPELACVLAFTSPEVDLGELGPGLKQSFDCPVISCTTAGQIGPDGFTVGGVTAASVAGPLKVHSFVIPLDDIAASVSEVAAEIVLLRPKSKLAFGLVLVDGLSLKEERLMATLHAALPRLPIVGGSAGDDLHFSETHVYFDGRFRQHIAVLHLFETDLPVAPVKFQHHLPSDQRLVITRADASTRTVYEINGKPATAVYANAVGVKESELTSQVVSKHPLLLRIGTEYFTRSLARVNADRSITFFCAIDAGLVLRVGRQGGFMDAVESAITELRESLGEPQLVIGCDCILRRLEMESNGMIAQVGKHFADLGVIGFSTYGEQYNAVHINQTFTGIAIGGAP